MQLFVLFLLYYVCQNYATFFNNYQEVVGYLKNKKIKDTLILIKASRSLKLENITSFLINQI